MFSIPELRLREVVLYLGGRNGQSSVKMARKGSGDVKIRQGGVEGEGGRKAEAADLVTLKIRSSRIARITLIPNESSG